MSGISQSRTKSSTEEITSFEEQKQHFARRNSIIVVWPTILLQFVLAHAAHVLEGGYNIIGFQGFTSHFWVGVFWFAIASKDDDPTLFEAFSDKVPLEVFGFHALAHSPHAQKELDDFDGIQEGPKAKAIGDLSSAKGTVEIEVLVAHMVEILVEKANRAMDARPAVRNPQRFVDIRK